MTLDEAEKAIKDMEALLGRLPISSPAYAKAIHKVQALENLISEKLEEIEMKNARVDVKYEKDADYKAALMFARLAVRVSNGHAREFNSVEYSRLSDVIFSLLERAAWVEPINLPDGLYECVNKHGDIFLLEKPSDDELRWSGVTFCRKWNNPTTDQAKEYQSVMNEIEQSGH